MSKISPASIVSKLFPEFYREEYPALIEFIEAYYEFVSSETYSGKILGIRDLDSTLELFVNQLRSELTLAMPESSVLDKRELLRNARAFYNSKGTEASYKFLLRALFGTEVEIFYPSSVILRASDGRWEQDVEIQVEITSGFMNSIVGSRLSIGNGPNPIIVVVNRIKQTIGNRCTLIIDKNFVGNIDHGDQFTCINSGTTGVILPVLSSVTIITGGTGFTAGEIHDVAGGAKIRVTRVENGSLRKVDIVRFSSGYTSGFTQTIGNAQLQFNIGAVSRYPGYFSSSNGFLSDAMRLQDNEYYQIYSYVLKLDEAIDRYRAIVKSLIHPVGWALFGEFEIINEIRLDVSLLEIARLLRQSIQDDVITEHITIFNTVKNLVSTTTSTHLLAMTSTKSLINNVTTSSIGSIHIQFGSDYATDYFAEVGTNQYSMGEGSIIRTW